MVSPVHLSWARHPHRGRGRRGSQILLPDLWHQRRSQWIHLVLLGARSEAYLPDLQVDEALDLGLISSVLLVTELTTDITAHACTALWSTQGDTPPLPWFKGSSRSQPAFFTPEQKSNTFYLLPYEIRPRRKESHAFKHS